MYNGIKMVKELYCRKDGGIYYLGEDGLLYIPLDLATMFNPNDKERSVRVYNLKDKTIDDMMKDSVVGEVEERWLDAKQCYTRIELRDAGTNQY